MTESVNIADKRYKEKVRIKANQGAIRSVRFNVDGEYVITCGADRTLKLWNLEKSLLLASYAGHSGPVLDAQGSNDNGQLISGSQDKMINYWDVGTTRILRRWRGHQSSVNTVLFNEESSVVISGSQDNSVRLWDVKSRNEKPIQILNEPKDSVNSLAINNNSILVGSSDGYMRLYDIRNGQMTEDCLGESVTCVRISRDNSSSLASVTDGTIKLIDALNGSLLGNYQGHCRGYEDSMDLKMESSFDFMDQYILTASPNGNVFVYDLVSEKIKEIVTTDSSGVPSTTISTHPKKYAFIVAIGLFFVSFEK